MRACEVGVTRSGECGDTTPCRMTLCGRDCVKSLRSSYTGLYPQSERPWARSEARAKVATLTKVDAVKAHESGRGAHMWAPTYGHRALLVGWLDSVGSFRGYPHKDDSGFISRVHTRRSFPA